jgi:thiamine kinase-like enzyme
MSLEPEDVAMTSYKVRHEVRFDWTEATPDPIATNIATLMRHLGLKYACENHFEIGPPKLMRGSGTTYQIQVAVFWVERLTIDT